MTPTRVARRRTFATTAGLTVGAAAYLLTLLDFSNHPTRTANSLGYASNFFDFQGRSFLDGRLAVPDGSLGIEGFIEHGREYMYFGPWPAILRMPILSTTSEYDGRLTVLSMALAFVLFAVMTARLVWLVRDLMRPGEEVSRFEAVAMGIFLAVATGGTTLTFAASLPWVYHEVYAWVIAFVVGAMYWMLRLLQRPDPAPLVWLAVCDLGAVMTRTTGGWAACLVTIAVGVWFLRGRIRGATVRLGLLAVLAGVVPILAGVALNWAKFHHLLLFPLEDQVWTEVNAHRREALEVNGGTITGLQFLPTAFMAYLRLDGLRFVDYFPYITLPAMPARPYSDAFIDQSYRTGSVTATTPLLVGLSILAVVVLFRRHVSEERRWLRFPLAVGLLVPGAIMVYGYFAYRYTAEFAPLLIMGGSIGMVTITRWLQRRPRLLKAPVLAAVTVLAAFSIATNMLIGHAAAAFTAGGPRLADYLELQRRLSPDRQADLVTFSDDLPSGGATDDLWIEGDCDSLWVNSGDVYDRWVLVERRSEVVEVTVAPDAAFGRIELLSVDTIPRRSVWLRLSSDGQARLELDNEGGTYRGAWFDLLEPRVVRVGVRDLPEFGYAEVSANPGGFRGLMRTFQWEEWISRPTVIEPVEHTRSELAEAGVAIQIEAGIAPPLCERIRGDALAARAG